MGLKCYLEKYLSPCHCRDLDGNGFPEVIADNAILNGRTGDVLHQFGISNIFIGRMPAIGDLDLDGRQEVIIANQCRRSDGSLAWESSIIGDYGHWSAILDADGDPQGEVAMVGAGQLAIYNHDGSLILSQPPALVSLVPLVADFDGDGQAEIARHLAASSICSSDGSVLWRRSVTDKADWPLALNTILMEMAHASFICRRALTLCF